LNKKVWERKQREQHIKRSLEGMMNCMIGFMIGWKQGKVKKNVLIGEG